LLESSTSPRTEDHLAHPVDKKVVVSALAFLAGKRRSAGDDPVGHRPRIPER
jgi:hypothetical protein